MPKATKRTGRREKPAHGVKAEFVRARPELTAPEIMALAKKEGIVLSVGHIYNIRASDKRRGVSRPTTNGRAVPERSNGRGNGGGGGAEESQLRALVIRMGLDRAEAVIGRLRTQLQDLE